MIEKNIHLSEIENIYKDNDVDGCLIGPYDLSMSIGKPGDFYNYDFKKIENFILSMKKNIKSVLVYILWIITLVNFQLSKKRVLTSYLF